MNRRVFIGRVAVGTLAGPCVALGQSASKVYRIGILSSSGTTADLVGPNPRAAPSLDALLRGLRELGYRYGEHFVTEPRGGESLPERFPRLAAELVRLHVDVIVASGLLLPALKRATLTIPIVMAAAPDPVRDGFVQSLAHPGGNFTGLSLGAGQAGELTGKRLELLKELVPAAALVAVLWDRSGLPGRQAAEAVARQKGWKLMSIELRGAGEIEGAFKAATSARVDALLVYADALLFGQARRIAELAVRSRLPAMYPLRHYVEAGGLISYGADLIELWRRAAAYVDKILKGANPATLPVEQPSKFDLVVNLNAAESIGLTIPPSVLLRANEVIQ